MFFPQFGFGGMFPNQFKTQYRCYSVSMLAGTDRQDVDRGGKSKLPNKCRILSRTVIDFEFLYLKGVLYLLPQKAPELACFCCISKLSTSV